MLFASLDFFLCKFVLCPTLLKLKNFGHLMQRTDSLKKTLRLGKVEERGQEEKGMTEDEMVGWHH